MAGSVLKLHLHRFMAAFRAKELQTAQQGYGPLLQRDYWAVIRECRFKPSEVMEQVSERFWEFAPEDLCFFARSDGVKSRLKAGDVLEIDIRMSAHCRVRVLHHDRNSITLGTLPGHPEAGRITFGAYRNLKRDVIFHIRSRARSSNAPTYAGFLAVGEAMQTNTWTDFVNRVAFTMGEGVVSTVHAETSRVDEESESADDIAEPTFVARGD
jgi:hypothetical protein